MRAKLRQIKQELHTRMHDPVPRTGEWLKSVVQGYFNYHAVPGNLESLAAFRNRTLGLWWRTLRRRSQKHRLSWTRMLTLAQRWLPPPRALHPYPADRFAGSLRRQSSEIRTGCANERPSGSGRGVPGNWYPYRDPVTAPSMRSGYPCSRTASTQCSDCGAELCESHAETCGMCRTVFCPACLSFHQTEHSKPASADRGTSRERKSA